MDNDANSTADEDKDITEKPEEVGIVKSDADDQANAETLRKAFADLKEEMAKVIVGQDEVVEQLLIAIFAKGHCLLVGVPGLAKTLMISTLAKTLSLSFNRIQFTPDLMPSDITGTEIIQENKTTGERSFQFVKGPIFANIILADEINRTPPKTQAALLEAMQEGQVSAGSVKHKLEPPFFVLATQNPIEQEGTYPLPEAQLDRFMFNTLVEYPNEDEEFEIIKRTTSVVKHEIQPVLSGKDIMKLQEFVRTVPAAEHVVRYAMKLVRSTRINGPDAPDFVNEWLSWGAGPRAAQYLILGGKARAVLYGRDHVSTADIDAVALPVLRHRIITNFSAEAEGITTDKVIERLITHCQSEMKAKV
ncbi:MAG: AAA family ATPase [Planctomycetota bacterium]|nr:AAA family ATPase [Planctomycetota bacterium]